MEFTTDLELYSKSKKIKTYAKVVHEYTDKEPPRIRLSLINCGDNPREVYMGFTPPFSQYILSDDQREKQNKIIIVPSSYPKGTEEFVPASLIDGCWTSSDIPPVLDTGMKTTLQPEEQINEEYTVINYNENPECFPKGRYSKKDNIGINDPVDGSELELTISVIKSVR